MRFRLAPLTTAMLLALVTINAWLLSSVLQSPPEFSLSSDSQWTPNLAHAAAATPTARSIGARSEILARPVFFKSRQPFVAPPPAPVPKPVSPPPPAVSTDPGLALGGIMMDGPAKRAYLVNKANSQGTWISEGDTITGWKLGTIDAASVTLQQHGRTILLQLYPPGP